MARRKLVHFVYGLRPQLEPFHLLHYLAIETCREVVRPDEIIVHCDALPFGVWWDRARARVTLQRVGGPLDEVRLDALSAHGGMCADIDTVFLRPVPDTMWDEPFVIAPAGVPGDDTGTARPSLCSALMMSQPGSNFAAAWRSALADRTGAAAGEPAGFLAAELAAATPDGVRIEPSESFYPVSPDADGLRSLLTSSTLDLSPAFSVHLWASQWWDPARRDVSDCHAGLFTADVIRRADTTLTAVLAPHVPDVSEWPAVG